MSDSYLIDGYNLIHALGLIERPEGIKALEKSRARLYDLLRQSFNEDRLPHVTLVFDAMHAPPRVSRHQTIRGMHVRFAPKKQSADDLIEQMIEQHPAPQRLIVISNDNRLKQAAVRAGARAWSDADLLDFLERRGKGTAPAKIPDDEKPARDMSSEENEHWKREFADLENDPELKEFFDIDRFDDDSRPD